MVAEGDRARLTPLPFTPYGKVKSFHFPEPQRANLQNGIIMIMVSSFTELLEGEITELIC